MTYSIFNGEEYYILSDTSVFKIKITFKKDSIPSLKKLLLYFYKKVNKETLYDNYINHLISNIPLYVFQNDNYVTKTYIQYKMEKFDSRHSGIKVSLGMWVLYYSIPHIQKLYKQLNQLDI